MDRLTGLDDHPMESAGSVADTDFLELEQTQPMERMALMRGTEESNS